MNYSEDKGLIVGTVEFHREPNMNYQFNRIHSVCKGDLLELQEASQKIKSVDEWTGYFRALAVKAESENRMRESSAYWRAFNFYLDPKSEEKKSSYQKYVTLIRQLNQDDFTGGFVRENKVPYENGFLPVWSMKAQPVDGQTAPKIVFHLGYDSFKEELLPVVKMFAAQGFDIWLFEGPGQGGALFEYGLTMTHEWEKPVKAVLDFFQLEDVTLIGLSLGGYLAPRAAAFEPRIKRVIAWGVLFDFFDVVTSRRGKVLEYFLKITLKLHLRFLLNAVVGLKMKKDSYTRWGVEHGMCVLGTKDPYGYFKKLRNYSGKTVSSLIKQDFLLMGSTHDHFIPEADFVKQISALTSVRSLTARLFTKEEHAENHVQFGNLALAVDCMCRWINERTA